MIGNLNKSEIEDLLKNQILCRIGCHADNTTYVVPMSYAYDGTYLYGHTTEGMKTEWMRKNPAVCVEVDDTKDMANWKSVIAWGNFEELTDSKERTNALQHLLERVMPILHSTKAHLSEEWPFSPENPDTIKGIVFRIRLENITGRYEQNISTSFFA